MCDSSVHPTDLVSNRPDINVVWFPSKLTLSLLVFERFSETRAHPTVTPPRATVDTQVFIGQSTSHAHEARLTSSNGFHGASSQMAELFSGVAGFSKQNQTLSVLVLRMGE